MNREVGLRLPWLPELVGPYIYLVFLQLRRSFLQNASTRGTHKSGRLRIAMEPQTRLKLTFRAKGQKIDEKMVINFHQLLDPAFK
jgi:hypothetical protein